MTQTQKLGRSLPIHHLHIYIISVLLQETVHRNQGLFLSRGEISGKLHSGVGSTCQDFFQLKGQGHPESEKKSTF